jgi:formamidopyrimidine-DNA glycosylase
MMWGSWAVLDNPPQEIDRRERSRIVVPDACAILYSAPIFDLGAGNPFEIVENLRTLGTDILPYPDEKPFDAPVFLQKLLTPENSDRTIGAALLDQQILAGIGNYLRAEILFDCRLDPWRKIADLTASELERLIHSIPLMAQRAYTTGGFTVSDEARTRLINDPSLVYTLEASTAQGTTFFAAPTCRV